MGRNVSDAAVEELIAAVVELVKAVTGDVVREELPSGKVRMVIKEWRR